MIRRAEVEDSDAVYEIIVQALGYACEEAVVCERIADLRKDDHYLTLVYVDDATEQVWGFIHATRYETLHRAGGWDVISLAVLTKEQGRGVGKALLSEFERRACDLGGTYVRLNSRVERTEAHGFYEHLGYDCDKTQKRFIKQLV